MIDFFVEGFDRSIHNIENAPFRTKFDKAMPSMKGRLGIGCISDYEPQPLMVRSHHGTYAITTVSKINNTDELVQEDVDKRQRLRPSRNRGMLSKISISDKLHHAGVSCEISIDVPEIPLS